MLLKVFLWDLKNCTLRFQRNNLRERFFRFFWNLYQTLGGISVGFLVRTFGEGCHNWFLHVQINIWRKVLGEIFFTLCLILRKKSSSLPSKCFGVVVNIAFHFSRGSTWEILQKCRFFNQIRSMSKKVWGFCQKTFSGRIKTSACPEEHFEEQQFLEKKFFLSSDVE